MIIDNLARAGRAAACASFMAGLVAGLAAVPAHAALGDHAAPAALAAARAVPGGMARVLSYVDAGGTTVNAYVAASTGRIFAYTWQGPTAPDLPALFGRYDTSYLSGAAALRTAGRDGLHAARVDQPGLVVELGGRMRGYIGRAWLPDALPAGLTEADLR